MSSVYKKILLVLLLLSSASCKNEPETSSIPYAFVSFDIDVSSSGAHNELRYDMLGGIILFTEANPSILSSVSASGYGYGGVAVVRGYDNGLYAFDMACPYEHDADIVLKSDGYFLYCPKCGTHYDVAWGGGSPDSNTGPGSERLKKYTVSHISNYTYRVTN